jgi:ubiquinone/menaquinone biosynthesis C-methylase UbiE
MNSVLHHILDLREFSRECTRVLRPNGILIASHEPNSGRHLDKPKNFLYKLAEVNSFAEKIMRSILSRISSSWKFRNEMLLKIANQLKAEGLIDYNLRGTEIQQIVDIHTHTGFSPDSVVRDTFPEFEMVESEIYNDERNLRFVLSVKNE